MDCQHSLHIRVFVDRNKRGEPVHETVPVHEVGEHTYELLSSPGLALNMARGDIICTAIPDQHVEVVKRGGNFCIHIYANELPQDAVDALEEAVQTQLGGTLDGRYKGNLTLAVPASNGFEAIAKVFDAFREQTGVQWYYANIYKNLLDNDDETLLNWWL
ncbi:DUF4265 domain-containing protein [Pseudomonas sp. MAFF212428]|uniref:DUF4265 domain-containing protein n=1 Tax=Pseudomonas brassicae TaxID=2708063 RepID=A0A6B3P2Z0_9PSED|nr:DUF4265 domain-containing protein [Pseudomonas brassicae]NER62478.1 DUF4265 domain-containing protein [Pseudomonas brassicae]NER66114.1 DUF4265 domain-containing protein [Pseudomonas brassicae]